MSSQPFKMGLREASRADIAALVAHHQNMFVEIWAQKGEPIGAERVDEIGRAYSQKLETELVSGSCKAWIIEDKGQIVASGAITVVSFVPNPFDLSHKVAYLHSMFTEKSHRNKQCAQQIIENAIKYCKSIGIKRVMLNASEAGRPVYEKIGFRSAPDTMRLLIK